MDHGVGQQLSLPLQLDPFKLISEAFRTDHAGRPDQRTTLNASYAHQFPLTAVTIEIFYDRQDVPLFVSHESFLACR
jgi:hypothetical protein